MTSAYLWCGEPYEPGRRGKPQRFCSAPHRRAYDKAVRARVKSALDEGVLTVSDLRNALQKNTAFISAPTRPRAVSVAAPSNQPPLEAPMGNSGAACEADAVSA